MLTGFLKWGAVVGISAGASAVLGVVVIRSWTGGERYRIAESLQGRMFVVTGATSGIGLATVRELAKAGASVHMAVRDTKACVTERRTLVNDHRNKSLYCRLCDLADTDTVRQYAAILHAADAPIDCLILNAGVNRPPERQLSRQGVEKQLAVNHLGHFLLANLLVDRMLKQERESRIVIVDCHQSAELAKELNFDDWNMEGEYDASRAYYRSKLANAMFARELASRCKGTKVSVTLVSPGKRVRTKFDRHVEHDQWFIVRWPIKAWKYYTNRPAEQAAWHVLRAATSDDPRPLNESRYDDERPVDFPPPAMDAAQRLRLWMTDAAWCRLDEQRERLVDDIAERRELIARRLAARAEGPRVLRAADVQQRKADQAAETAVGDSGGAPPATDVIVLAHGAGKPWYQFW